ncbi:flavin reductase family protein [Ancylobacter sp. WKF20]|uniref:flavin reductase family protein n=1 Tax=Ancylobacter sp. WKF20 TaxID=3039801 RepID=UPI0024342373|nr:flavin reductase family protein [Ancylobacter sp. WKF20]WGD29727.1 flavin reductase family protein [Ancylobacter sp. WKF20]
MSGGTPVPVAEAPPEGGAISFDNFRKGMRRLVGAVNVITTAHEGRLHGLTATAVCSLSGEPPRLLACVNVVGKTFEYILQSRRMGVNVLGHRHVELARRFANMTDIGPEQRFADAHWITPHSGAPVLADALVGFDCKVDEIFVTPSHGVIIGEIKHVTFGPDGPPLLYAGGSFTTVHPDNVA